MKKILILLLSVVLIFGMVACGSETENDADDKPETEAVDESTAEKETDPVETELPASFEVTVVDESGAPVSGVMVQICKDTCIPAKTDDSGVALFNLEITDGHKLSVLTLPEGYTYDGEAEIYLDSGITEYTLEVTKG